MQNHLNQKVLITTSAWFVAPNGQEYRAVWGTLKAIHEAGKSLGFIPNRSHANWFVEVGNMIIMGCQVMYIVSSPEKPNQEKSLNWTTDAGKIHEYERPCVIYFAE